MTATPAKLFFRRPDCLAALLGTVAILALHFFFLLHAGGFWRDEVNVINLAGSHDISYMVRDSFPILMPVLIKGWTALGWSGSDLNLRLLGSLIGLSIAVDRKS